MLMRMEATMYRKQELYSDWSIFRVDVIVFIHYLFFEALLHSPPNGWYIAILSEL